jgi:hypothetical protein
VTIAHTPLLPRRDGDSSIAVSTCSRSEIFFARGLDDPNHVDKSREIGFYAQRILRLKGACEQFRPRQNAS